MVQSCATHFMLSSGHALIRSCSHPVMLSSSILANARQLLRALCTLCPAGHHSTLPLPMISVPSNVSPVRMMMDMELSLLRLVNSTEDGKWATALV